MGANDVHGARSKLSLPGCYIATVNESETIMDAQPFCADGAACGAFSAGVHAGCNPAKDGIEGDIKSQLERS
jgi:hypothetical protein